MGLNAHLLNGVLEATSPPSETEAAARSRHDAIAEMFQVYNPTVGLEVMIVSHCVMSQFLLNAATRDASNINPAPASLGRNHGSAMSISRTLHQWVTKFENTRKRNETRAA